MIRKIDGVTPSSEYLLFIDESGDHGLDSISEQYPIFVLCGVLIRKDEYLLKLCPSIGALKMSFWGHDEVVLHEKEIRKSLPPFEMLRVPHIREAFHSSLAQIMAETDYTLIYSVIRKREYLARHPAPQSPYDLSMSFVLERAYRHLEQSGHASMDTCVIVERRGRHEDAQLVTAFHRIASGENACRRRLPFLLTMTSKVANSAGLQMADIAARPIGLRTLRPEQPNRAFDVLRPKIRRNAEGKTDGWGVKLFPPP